MEIIKYINELNKMIVNSTNIFIMGHRYLDLDALGSAIGIYEYIKEKGKRPAIIINDKKNEKAVKKVLDDIKDEYSFKKSNNIKDKISKDSLLIIVDTNKDYLLQDKELFNMFKRIVVIDHHDENKQSIKKGLLIIDKDASSACEMITDLLDKENIKIDKKTATILLSGIVLDTNNYVIKTTKETYRTSYILSLQGADPRYVQYLLKQDLKEYVARQKVITDVKQIKNIAISKGKSKIVYRREDLAKIADTLLQFDKIKASFVIGKLENGEVGISARSLGTINVGKILEKFNGGGDENEAGATVKDSNTKKVEEDLKNIIRSLN